MNELRINADDFGLHPDLNRGILDTVEAGVVGSVSACAAGSAPDWACLRRLKSAGVSVGLHWTLTGEPWLTTGETISGWRALVRRLGSPGFIRLASRELAEQAARFRTEGLAPDHVDSHQHVHLLPGLWPACLGLGIERIRVPAAPRWTLARRTVGGLALQSLAALRRRAAKARPCIGLAQSGRYTFPRIERELAAARGQDLELIVHPGIATPAALARYGSWHYDWSGERAALLDPRLRTAAEQAGFRIAGP